MLEKILKSLKACQTEAEFEALTYDYLKHAQEDGHMFELLVEIATYFGQRGYVDWQIHLLKNLYDIQPQVRLVHALLDYFVQWGELDQAETWLAKLNSQKESFDYRYYQALIAQEAGNNNLAIKLYRALVRDYPTQVKPYLALVELYQLTKDIEPALSYLKILKEYFSHEIDESLINQQILVLSLEGELIDWQLVEDFYGSEPQWNHLSLEELLVVSHFALATERYALAEDLLNLLIDREIECFEAHISLLNVWVIQGNYRQANQKIAWLFRTLPIYDERLLDIIALIQENEALILPDFADMKNLILITEDEEWRYSLIMTYFESLIQDQVDIESLKTTINELIQADAYIESYSYLLGRMAELEKDWEKALIFYQQALEMRLNEIQLGENLLRVYQELQLPLEEVYDLVEGSIYQSNEFNRAYEKAQQKEDSLD